MNTLSKIRDIFYSGDFAFNGESESINEISFLLDEKYLFLDSVEIAKKLEYVRLADEIARKHIHDAAAGGGYTHIALKVLSGRYLQKTKGRQSLFEQPFCGYFPDVLCEDKSIAVECGHTQNPRKMLDYFRQGGIQEFIQVPYPSEDDNVLTGFVFTVGDQLIEFLNFLDETTRNKTKEVFRKRDRPEA
ncbi:MAG: hypothetical protein UY39_C0013G0012 [Candidatus Kaiserbacteria bacterium GW2011_GWC2_49_12]|uniref:Uncharacterized protein n=4 Tax=Candidatus Kaiseribacteriota TaxID=1752734 RepID=A0A0G1WGI3_9BACT|nr:MAG: hypothetical protein UY39_C0013G0012 [Candidatus Kaiserbacteria bacterium GW2011_GWC2_49_12]KKW17715.1 MAG: hypothetical protein UY57_C0011G0012 [Candidatus Kaiserbacteria bacterium GW2011_GWB1_50_17]KKW18327.1 MAG: hypothetical protein UY59_C0009G0012 [Candidatus Kaiserbacteria bacterium GW2011_GWA1_50_28]OGG87814.1 MAG: hypothetical protein A3H15_00135 [Candidatus Kaiserbacteria bacterium RIFCSPLOWO2_12_FULL_50_28]HCM43948.1 hypothetical protein [Candidatus Kaiserbacteria bacterium]